jgi:hypothetical protein
MQSNKKINYDDFTLIIIKNPDLLQSVYDYFYQNLLHDFDEQKTITINLDEINECLKTRVKTKYVFVIQEGIFFFEHMDNNFLKSVMNDLDQYSLVGHVLDRKERYYQIHQQQFILNVDDWRKANCPNFNHTQSDELVVIKRSTDNFHDDHTPLWIEQTKDITSHNRLKFGGYVISEMLKHNFKIRPFNENERHVKKFVYYDIEEQVKHMLSYEQINPHSYYYPISTAHRNKQFTKEYTNYISVANGIESLKRISNTYQQIKKITFYDTSITALIFTELLIKNFNSDYKKFVQDFDMMGGSQWTTIDITQKPYKQLENYDINDILPVIEYIRNNVRVTYLIGDITRPSIVENVDQDTLINLSNVFDYNFNLIRKSEYADWCNKIANSSHKFEVLR